MPTIIDVAKAAGVSIATVSRVLSQPGRVSEQTRQRVMDEIDRLGYKPNVVARALRTHKAAKILVTVPDISNPFFASVIRGAEEVARDADYAVVLGDTRHDPALENQYAQMVGRREVDGMIFLGHRLPDSVHALVMDRAGAVPVVNGCEYSQDLIVPSVHIDNAAAGRDAMLHLIGLGHRAMGIITGPLVGPISRDRLAGARAVAADHGLSDQLRVLEGDFSAGSGFDNTAALLEQGVTALFCFSDEMAMGAIGAIRASGRSCPDHVSVIGFDDIAISSFFEPPLTTVVQPKEAIGREAMKMLLDILGGRDIAVAHLTLPHELVVRGSTSRRAPV